MNLSPIEWLQGGLTWNPITGCPGPKVSPGCANCYAERVMNTRLRHLYEDSAAVAWHGKDPFAEIIWHEKRIEQPIRRKKPSRIFVCSMGDLFHEYVSTYQLQRIWDVMTTCRQHTFMVLTKRPERMLAFIRGRERRENIWLGVTVCNQAEADEKLVPLDFVYGWNYYLSVEPMLGSVTLEPRHGLGGCMGSAIKWIICGGESGPGARPMHPDWVRSLRDQCVGAVVPFFFKGWGEYYPFVQGNSYEKTPGYFNCYRYLPACFKKGRYSHPSKTDMVDYSGRSFAATGGYPEGTNFEELNFYYTFKGGKRLTGRLLDGREWNEAPS